MKRRAFSLVELLVVVAIIAVLATLATGGFTSAVQSGKVEQAGHTVLDEIEKARQVAAVRGKTAEVRIFKNTGATHYTGMQVWLVSPAEPASRLVKFPESVALLDDPNLSPWLGQMTPGSMPVGGEATDYLAFKVRPSGAIDPAPPDRNKLFLTVAADRTTADSKPSNYATIQLNPDTGRPLLYRP